MNPIEEAFQLLRAELPSFEAMLGPMRELCELHADTLAAIAALVLSAPCTPRLNYDESTPVLFQDWKN